MAEATTSVVTGVNEGEQVITDGADKVQPHGKVEIGREGKAGPGGLENPPHTGRKHGKAS
jgi:hypothetical protein